LLIKSFCFFFQKEDFLLSGCATLATINNDHFNTFFFDKWPKEQASFFEKKKQKTFYSNGVEVDR